MSAKHMPGHRCSNCKWIHEADSVAGTSFMGVELCPLHASAPDLLEVLRDALDSEDSTLIDGGSILGDDLRQAIKAAIAKAEEK